VSAAVAVEPRHPLGLPSGIHPGVPAAAYHTSYLGLVSKGALSAIGRSPRHYRAWLEQIQEDTPALSFGRAFHCAILEPDVFAREYVVAPDFGDCRFKDAKAARDEWRKENDGKAILSLPDMNRIECMIASVRAHELGSLVLAAGEAELTIAWQDEETGLYCKARPDYHVRARSMVVDVKTTEDARPDHFARDAVRYDYPLQDALYRAAFAAVDEPVDHFLFLAVEKSPPYDVSVCTLDEFGVGRGYARSRAHMSLMRECLLTDHWPGYEPRIHVLALPHYYD
jgi:hypothetical protein